MEVEFIMQARRVQFEIDQETITFIFSYGEEDDVEILLESSMLEFFVLIKVGMEGYMQLREFSEGIMFYKIEYYPIESLDDFAFGIFDRYDDYDLIERMKPEYLKAITTFLSYFITSLT